MLGNARDCHTQATECTKTNFFFPNKPPSYHPLPYRYFRATSTPKVEIPVCALSTTKGTVQFDPADYPGFCTAYGWEGASSALEKQPPLSPCQRLSGRVSLPARYFCCILLLIHLHSCTAVLFLSIPGEIRGFSNPSHLWGCTTGESASCWPGHAAGF